MRKIKQGGILSPQISRVMEVNDFIRSGTLTIGNEIVELTVADFEIETYLPFVREAVKQCKINDKGYSESYVDEVMFIRAIKISNLKENLSFPFREIHDWMYFSSLDTLYPKNAEVYWNKVPYSVFPLPEEDVLGILSGEIILESFIDFTMLKKKLEDFGWRVTRHSELKEFDNRPQYGGKRIFQSIDNTTIFTLSKDGFNLSLSSEHIGLIYLDFFKPSYLNNLAVFLWNISRQDRLNRNWHVAYVADRYIWI